MYDIAKAYYEVTTKVSSKKNLKKRIRKPYNSWQSSYEKARNIMTLRKLSLKK